MSKYILAAIVLAFVPTAAGSVDLANKSRLDRRIYCVAYVAVELEWQHQNGMVDEATYSHDRSQLIWKIQNRGDNYNYAGDFRKLDLAIQEIVAEDPTVGEVTAQAASCRSLLRL